VLPVAAGRGLGPSGVAKLGACPTSNKDTRGIGAGVVGPCGLVACDLPC
jgi:hypothetical protein